MPAFALGLGPLRVWAAQSGTPPRPSNSQRPDPFNREGAKGPGNSYVRPSSKSRSSPYSNSNRRRGRPASLRSPDDSPLRDGNRDRLIGLLTERAAKTLLVYLSETNPTVYHWLYMFVADNPIPIKGSWDEISGEVFLRKMLTMQSTTTKMEGRAELFDNMATAGVEPRQLAQRIMDIRIQLSKEFVQDLGLVAEENSILLRETLANSLANTLQDSPTKLPPREQPKVFIHPELLEQDGKLHPDVVKTHPELVKVVQTTQSTTEASGAESPAGPKGPAPPAASDPSVN